MARVEKKAELSQEQLTEFLHDMLLIRRFEGTKPGFRFRIARRSGYGVSATMARRSLERLDEEGFGGDFRVLRVLSDTKNVQTQGPVWRVDGAAV